MAELHDPIADGREVFETLRKGGVAIFKADVGYAIVGRAESAIARIYEAKARSFSKPCGMFGSWDIFREIIDIDERAKTFVSAIIHNHNLPLSIVAPFRKEHLLFRDVAPFVMRNATKNGTIDLLMNAGPTHDEIARLTLEQGQPVFGSSANRSLTGSKFILSDVEEEVRAAADLALDRGACKYSNGFGLGSSIIDLQTFTPIRIGICFPEIKAIAADEFSIVIPDRVAAG